MFISIHVKVSNISVSLMVYRYKNKSKIILSYNSVLKPHSKYCKIVYRYSLLTRYFIFNFFMLKQLPWIKICTRDQGIWSYHSLVVEQQAGFNEAFYLKLYFQLDLIKVFSFYFSLLDLLFFIFPLGPFIILKFSFRNNCGMKSSLFLIVTAYWMP